MTITVKKTQTQLVQVQFKTRGPIWGTPVLINEFFLTMQEAKQLRHKLSKYDK